MISAASDGSLGSAGTGGAPVCLARKICAAVPTNGSFPVTASNSITPSAYQSLAGVASWLAHCSGAM